MINLLADPVQADAGGADFARARRIIKTDPFFVCAPCKKRRISCSMLGPTIWHMRVWVWWLLSALRRAPSRAIRSSVSHVKSFDALLYRTSTASCACRDLSTAKMAQRRLPSSNASCGRKSYACLPHLPAKK